MQQDGPSLPAEAGTGFAPDEYRTQLERFSDQLTRLGLWMTMSIILVMMGIVAVDLVMRNLLGRSLMIVDEVVGQLTVAMAFLGVSHSLRRHALLRVEVLYRRLSPKGGAVCRVGFNLASMIYVALIIWFGLRLVDSSLRLDIVSLSLLQTPMWIPQLVIPIGGGLLLLALVAELLRDLRRLRQVWREGEQQA